MFNRTIYNSKSEVVAVTRVVEKTISPDKVTDMYKDVEDKIIGKYFIESNQLLVDLAIFIVACAYFYEKTGLRIF